MDPRIVEASSAEAVVDAEGIEVAAAGQVQRRWGAVEADQVETAVGFGDHPAGEPLTCGGGRGSRGVADAEPSRRGVEPGAGRSETAPTTTGPGPWRPGATTGRGRPPTADPAGGNGSGLVFGEADHGDRTVDVTVGKQLRDRASVEASSSRWED